MLYFLFKWKVLINKFEKVPKKQEIIEINNFLFTVLSADSKKINRIQLTIKKDNNIA